MSFIDIGGRSPRFLTRAQKWAMTSESAPSSSKKWLPAGTCSVCMTPARTSARVPSMPAASPVVAAPVAGAPAVRGVVSAPVVRGRSANFPVMPLLPDLGVGQRPGGGRRPIWAEHVLAVQALNQLAR